MEQCYTEDARKYRVDIYPGAGGVPVEFPVTTRRDNPEPATQRHNYTTPASVPSRNVTQLSVCDDDSRRGGLRGGRVACGVGRCRDGRAGASRATELRF